jgi:hypothetical protein
MCKSVRQKLGHTRIGIKSADMGEGVSKIAKKVLTYFMDGPINKKLEVLRGQTNHENENSCYCTVRLWNFKDGGYGNFCIRNKNQYTRRKLLNFEFWINGELSKLGHHFSNKVI